MKILHLCWGLEATNGAANIARMILREQQASGHAVELASRPTWKQLRTADQVWCHCGWYWLFWFVAFCKRFLRPSSFASFHWMPEACYDPVRLAYHGWKKSLVGPIERWALRQADVLVATCPVEARWIRDYVGKGCPPVEVTDIRRFFELDASTVALERDPPGLRILYLGRRHPLKGVRILEQAIKELNHHSSTSTSTSTSTSSFNFSLRLVSDHAGTELERDWAWCDVLCLPTLSDNFGLVVAEALAHGKRVVTTDGAPAWDPSVTGTDYGGRLVYIKNYREAPDDASRIALLRTALAALA